MAQLTTLPKLMRKADMCLERSKDTTAHVLQHVPEFDLSTYVKDFARLVPRQQGSGLG